MANKLAGQRAKFSRGRAIYFTSSEESQRRRAVQLMAEVLVEAPANNFLRGVGNAGRGRAGPSAAIHVEHERPS